MVKIKPFRGIRPPSEYAAEVASRPYDVLKSAEARDEATERSLLHIIKAEIDFDDKVDEHSPEVYDKAVENFRLWKERGWLRQDDDEYYYISGDLFQYEGTDISVTVDSVNDDGTLNLVGQETPVTVEEFMSGLMMTDEEIAERMKELSYLKIHPRDQEENRLLLLRAERMYEESMGDVRRYLDLQIRQFEEILNTRDRGRIEEGREALKEALKEIEEDW